MNRHAIKREPADDRSGRDEIPEKIFKSELTSGGTNNSWELWLSELQMNTNTPGCSSQALTHKFTPMHQDIYTVATLDSSLSYAHSNFPVGCAYVFLRKGMSMAMLDPANGFGYWMESPFCFERNKEWGHISHWRFECITLMQQNLIRSATRIEKLFNGQIKMFIWTAYSAIPDTSLHPNEY